MNTPLNIPNGTTFNCIIFFVLTNAYGQTHAEVLNNLRTMGVKVFRTNEQER